MIEGNDNTPRLVWVGRAKRERHREMAAAHNGQSYEIIEQLIVVGKADV